MSACVTVAPFRRTHAHTFTLTPFCTAVSCFFFADSHGANNQFTTLFPVNDASDRTLIVFVNVSPHCSVAMLRNATAGNTFCCHFFFFCNICLDLIGVKPLFVTKKQTQTHFCSSLNSPPVSVGYCPLCRCSGVSSALSYELPHRLGS